MPRPRLARWLTLALMAGVAGAPFPAGTASANVRSSDVFRYAVVIGANGAPEGRATLRYAYRDADAFAEVLLQTGGFAPENVNVLRDPSPGDVLKALEQGLSRAAARLSGQALLVFYYSGHADTDRLYPAGRPLLVAQLRGKLADERATVRLGIIDACRGGGWTGSKGLTPTEPFDVDLPSALSSEGSRPHRIQLGCRKRPRI